MLTAYLNICRLAFFVCAVLLNPTVEAISPALIVTSAADSGPGSLRQTIADAKAGDVINFESTPKSRPNDGAPAGRLVE